MAILSTLLTAIIIIVSILIVLIVLVQRPKQEGLGAAFGGGAFDSALGAHTTDVLQKITTYFAAIFFLSAIGLAMVKARQFTLSPASNVLENVENLEAPVPSLPPGISNLPGADDLTSGLDITTPIEEGKPTPVVEEPADVTPEDATPEAPKGGE